MTDAEKNNMPLCRLGNAIAVASACCADQMKKFIQDDTEKVHRQSLVYFEFTYFFMHLTNRVAFRVLGNERRIKLQDELWPAAVHATIESLCGNWPPDMKEKIKHEFVEKLNDAEVEYSKCQLRSSDNPLSSDSNGLFPKLGRNVAELAGRSGDGDMIQQIVFFARTSFASMNLDTLVEEAGNSL